MLKAKLENLERILHGVSDERERLKVEFDNPRLRVTIAGDKTCAGRSAQRSPGPCSATFTLPRSG